VESAEELREAYTERVLQVAESVPPGRVISYGGIADVLAAHGYGGGPRQVGRVMATEGGAVPWWRVVRADGTLPGHLHGRARQHYLTEGTPLHRLDAPTRVDIARAWWQPEV